MSKKPKKSMEQTQSSSQMSQPQWLQDHGKRVMNYAEHDLKNNPTYAPFSDESSMGMQQMFDMASNPMTAMPGGSTAYDEFGKTLGGEYLHGGQGYNEALDAATRRIIPQVTSAFNAGGRMGGIQGQSELASRIGDSYASQWGGERNRMTTMMGMLPMLQQAQYDPALRMMGVGQMRENKQLEEQNDTRNRLAPYMAAYQGVSPFFQESTGTQQRPVYSGGGGLGSMLGAGLSIAGMMGGIPPIGLLGGAGAGAAAGGMTGLGLGSIGNYAFPALSAMSSLRG